MTTHVPPRTDRRNDEMREFSLTPDIARYAEGSCEVRLGHTVVRCTATAENRLPPFLRGKNRGWLTAEYAMLPRATQTRTERKNQLEGGRGKEIQRLIGRSLRSICDCTAFPDWQIRIDCDVIEADGGTRTAAVNGAFVAAARAFDWMRSQNILKRPPLTGYTAAISAGVINGDIRLDLDYAEDQYAQTDANFVLDDRGALIEVQAAAEQQPFSAEALAQMIALAQNAAEQIITCQKNIIGPLDW